MNFEIHNYRLLCNKGSSEFNEDILGLSHRGAWVLDGATGLSGKNFISSETDVKWYVNWWNKYLHENISKKDTLKNIIKDGIERIRKEYMSKLECDKVNELQFPCCSCVILKFHDDKIEYLILGDCTLFAKDKESTEIITDEMLSNLDKEVYDYMDKLENVNNLSINEKKSKAMQIITNNRLKKNKDNGYWILEFSKEAVDRSINGFINIEDKIEIMLTSDGFSCASDRYELFKKEELIDIARSKGIEYIYNKIRDLEINDNKGIEFNRFKISDDSSCIYMDIKKLNR